MTIIQKIRILNIIMEKELSKNKNKNYSDNKIRRKENPI